MSGPSKGKDGNQHIYVAVRCRPMNGSEAAERCWSVVDCAADKKTISIKERMGAATPTRTFAFDRVFGAQSKQIEVYKAVVEPAIEEVIMGYNCTIFAYGQTGTGKTFTMEGERSAEHLRWEDDPQAGIIPRALAHLFEKLEAAPECEFSMRISYLELYNEELFDLLGTTDCDQRLRIFDDASKKGSVVIQGLEEVVVRTKHEVYGILQKGSQRRQTAATIMNATSSRSHTVFTVTIHTRENSVDGEELVKTGKLNLVDLAGSENIGRSGAVNQRAREAGNINQSLLTLGRVITSLVEHAPHVPYRESKLTRILQDSLGGRTKTSIIATISPASNNLEETLSTLDYAYRAKNIQNKPEINQRLTKKALIKEYNDEIERLRKDLQAARDKNGIFINEDNYREMQMQLASQGSFLKEQEENMNALAEENSKLIDENVSLREDLQSSKATLEETTLKLTEAEQNLERTITKLVKTQLIKEEQTHLVQEHIKSEAALQAQAKELLSTVTCTTTDIHKLQQSLARKSAIEKSNFTLIEEFISAFSDQMGRLHSDMQLFGGQQKEASDTMASILSKSRQFHSTQAAASKAAIEAMRQTVEADLSALVNNVGSLSAISQEESAAFTQHCAALKEQIETSLSAFGQSTVRRFKETLSCLCREQDGLLESILKEHDEMCAAILQQRCSFEEGLFNVLESSKAQVRTFNATVQTFAAGLEECESQNRVKQMEYQKRQDERLRQMQELITVVHQEHSLHMEDNYTFGCVIPERTRSLVQEAQGNMLNGLRLNDQLLEVNNQLLLQIQDVQQRSSTKMSSLHCKYTTSSEGLDREHSAVLASVVENSDTVQNMVNAHRDAMTNQAVNFCAKVLTIQNQAEQEKQVAVGRSASCCTKLSGDVQSTEDGLNAQTGALAEASHTVLSRTADFVHASCQTVSEGTAQLTNLCKEKLQKDTQTGLTPQKTTYKFPQQLTRPLVHKSLLDAFRAERLARQEALGAATALPSDDDDEVDEAFLANGEAGNNHGDLDQGEDCIEPVSAEDNANLELTKVSIGSLADVKENLLSEDKSDAGGQVTQRRGRIPRGTTPSTAAADLKAASAFKRPTTPTEKSKPTAQTKLPTAASKLTSAPKRKQPDSSPGVARKQLKPTNQ